MLIFERCRQNWPSISQTTAIALITFAAESTPGRFDPIGRQESHALFGLSQSNALLRIAIGESLRAGEIVDIQIWD